MLFHHLGFRYLKSAFIEVFLKKYLYAYLTITEMRHILTIIDHNLTTIILLGDKNYDVPEYETFLILPFKDIAISSETAVSMLVTGCSRNVTSHRILVMRCSFYSFYNGLWVFIYLFSM
jgi:hypothetical protein